MHTIPITRNGRTRLTVDGKHSCITPLENPGAAVQRVFIGLKWRSIDILPDINNMQAHPLPCNNNRKNNWLVAVSLSVRVTAYALKDRKKKG